MRKLLFPIVLIVVLLLSACSSKDDFKADYKEAVRPFSYTNHHNEEVSLDDLKGDVWLAQFVFSNCTTVCGPMMHNMAELQDALIEKGVEDYKIVSFTLYPVNDMPDERKGYLEQFAPSDESKWEMLTGYKQSEIIEVAKKSFFTIVADDPNSDQVIHGTSFILIDQEGNLVKMYNGVNDGEKVFSDYMDDIANDIKALSERS